MLLSLNAPAWPRDNNGVAPYEMAVSNNHPLCAKVIGQLSLILFCVDRGIKLLQRPHVSWARGTQNSTKMQCLASVQTTGMSKISGIHLYAGFVRKFTVIGAALFLSFYSMLPDNLAHSSVCSFVGCMSDNMLT